MVLVKIRNNGTPYLTYGFDCKKQRVRLSKEYINSIGTYNKSHKICRALLENNNLKPFILNHIKNPHQKSKFGTSVLTIAIKFNQPILLLNRSIIIIGKYF